MPPEELSEETASKLRPEHPYECELEAEMRAMYVIYLVLIATGILFYAAIGLMHN